MGFISDLLIEISSFRIRVGNKLNTLANRIGVLNNLTTTNKNNLVDAINEVDGSLENYLPLAGGTMTGDIDWTGSGFGLSKSGDKRIVLRTVDTVISAQATGTTSGIIFRPQGSSVGAGAMTLRADGLIISANDGISSQWKQAFDWGNFRDFGLGTEAVVNTGLLENINETGFYAFSTSQQGFTYPRAILMKRGSQNYGLIFQNSGNRVGFLTADGSVYTAWHSGNFNPSDYAAASSVAYYNDGDNVNSNVSWGTNVVGGARNQIQGGRNIVKGEDINIFGSRNVSSGINNQINGFVNVVNGAFNTLTGAYSSIAGSQSNTIGNYLFARDNQTVLGMYNKVYNVGDDEGLRVAFGTGSNDFDKFNAVEIYDDHRTEFHGKAKYNEKTRNPDWFTEDYTHVDTYQVGYDHLPHNATSSTPCEHNILEVSVRGNDRFIGVNNLELAFRMHGIVKGNLVENTIDSSKVYTKGTLEFSNAVRLQLLEKADINKNPYLVVEYNFVKEEIYVKYVGAFYLKDAKSQDDKIIYILGSFINKRGPSGQPDITYFEFNQQII